ncbi:DUF7415 domain-containing protein [Enterobacter hormaechei]|uniref:DUF7415 domain-containing protein n=1 Tax=Enterobacter hormaechei TaxID=158836 RepID=UPI0015C5428C|nr:hypothetical protein [Enterobacter hormaechei]NQD84510.1 hypothetical protein [Enterobacter hormaechei]
MSDTRKRVYRQRVSVRVTNVIDLTEWVANYVMLSFQLMLDDADCGMTIMNWKELSEKGLVFIINHEILHPPGLAVGYEMTNGISAGASWLITEPGNIQTSLLMMLKKWVVKMSHTRIMPAPPVL